MSKSQPGRKGVGGPQRRHVVAAHVPRGRQQGSNKTAGKYSSRLQSIEAEDVAPMARITAPVVDDIKNLGADDSGEHHVDAQIPGVVAVDALLLGVADADPQAKQYARRDKESIGGQIEAANMKESRKHVSSLDAEKSLAGGERHQ